jgi:glutathione S-transferase
MLEPYRLPFSNCSDRVRLVLEEKRLESVSHEVSILASGQHDPDDVKPNPMHVVPTLVQDGQLLIESSLIIDYLDDAFPEPAMRPKNAPGRHAVDAWLERVDEELHKAAWPKIEALARHEAARA